jgi:5-methylcytosine-specific restriction enzyme subunit McrC
MLKDCSCIDLAAFAKVYFGKRKADRTKAEDWLRSIAAHEWSDDNFFSLGGEKKHDPEPVIYADMYGKWWTGRYIGSLTFDGVTIDIQPRFDIQFVMDNMPLMNVVAVDVERDFGKGGQFIHYLQALLWLNQLIEAARHTLPAVKVDVQHESYVCRGRLDVRGTIKQRAKVSDKVVSISRHKELVNPVSIAITLAFQEIQKWFPSHDVMHFLPATVALRLQQLLNAVKRHSKAPTYTELNKVRLTSMARGYKSLAVLSLDLLKRKGVSEKDGEQNNQTLLLDVAEVWECYVLSVLNAAAGQVSHVDIEVDHGTYTEGTYLLKGSNGRARLGKLLPDYLIKQAGNTLMIADAKYKRLGDAPWHSPKRDDLYQMTAYMNAHPDCQQGILLYPLWDDKKVSKVEANNPWKLQSGQVIHFVTISSIKENALNKLELLDAFRVGSIKGQFNREIALEEKF